MIAMVTTPPHTYAIGTAPIPTNWLDTKTNDEQI